MPSRRVALVLLIAGLAGALPALAQPAEGKWRLGFLSPSSSRSPVWLARLEQMRQGLRELGYVEGRNLTIDARWADGDLERMPHLAAELVALKPDVILTATTPGAFAMKRATQTIPVVFASVGDPVFTGLVSSLARPGCNLTGSSLFTADELGKRFELIRDVLPRARRIAVLVNPGNPLWASSLREAERVAETLKLQLERLDVRVPADFDGAFATAAERRVDAVALVEDSLLTGNAKRIAELSLQHKLPAVGQVVFADAGGLIGNGTNQLVLFRRSAMFVDRILKGAKPADLPIEQATRFEMIINQKTAKSLGITIPKHVLFRADRVIE